MCPDIVRVFEGEGKIKLLQKKQSLHKNVLFLHEGMKDSHLVSTKDSSLGMLINVLSHTSQRESWLKRIQLDFC